MKIIGVTRKWRRPGRLHCIRISNMWSAKQQLTILKTVEGVARSIGVPIGERNTLWNKTIKFNSRYIYIFSINYHNSINIHMFDIYTTDLQNNHFLSWKMSTVSQKPKLYPYCTDNLYSFLVLFPHSIAKRVPLFSNYTSYSFQS